MISTASPMPWRFSRFGHVVEDADGKRVVTSNRKGWVEDLTLIRSAPEMRDLVSEFLAWGQDHTDSPHDLLVRAAALLERIENERQ